MATVAPVRATPVDPIDQAQISRVPYLPGLDGLRAIAVVAVIVYHADAEWLPGGFLGVEMFFVISGYLITLLLIAERERTYRISLGRFWMRRARRLLPAVFLMMLLVTIWTALFERDALGQLRGDVLAGTFYVSNWYQIWVGLGYTASGDFAPLRHLWSLAVEEQFYLIWPIVMLLLLKWSGTRRVADVSRWIFGGAVVLALLTALAFHPGPIGEPAQTPDAYWDVVGRPIAKLDTLYLGTFTRLGGLMLGSAFALVWRPYAVMRGPLRTKGRLFDVGALVALIALAWICWSIHLVTPDGAAAGLFRGGLFASGIAMLMLIAAVTHRGTWASRLLGIRPLVWIGLRSYGLYLYHWPVFMIVRGVAGNALTLREFGMAMAATVAITELSYRFVEIPIRTGRFSAGWRRFRARQNELPRPVLVGGTAALLGVTLFAVASLATAKNQENEIAQTLSENEAFVTDLLTAEPRSIGPAVIPSDDLVDDPPPTTVRRSTVLVDDRDDAPTAELTNFAPLPTSPAGVSPVADTTLPAIAVPTESVPVEVVPADTVPAPVETVPAPVTQLGVINDMSTMTPLVVPPAASGFQLVALGDSVMLGAAEELIARGFVVDAVVSRQMKTYLPDMQVIKDNGTFGSVVVVHLGTNGSFGQETLDQMMTILADVPVVLVLTARADRGWVGDNNDRLRALPASYANTTVLDWEVLSSQCEGRCFYGDGIHLTQSGQNFYSGLIAMVLGLS